MVSKNTFYYRIINTNTCFYFIIYCKIRSKKIYYLNRISCIWFRLNPLNISIVWFTSEVGFSLSAADNSLYPRTQSFQNSHGQIISILNLQTLSSTSNSIYVQSPIAFYINLVTRSELATVPFQAINPQTSYVPDRNIFL